MSETRTLRLHCPCGESIKAASEDEIVELAMEHLRAVHPDRASEYTREHILAITI